VTLSDEVECDEAYVIAGHKGQPEVVKSKERQGRRRRLHGKAGRGTLATERPPVFGMMQRGGQVVIHLLANVQQKTIEPFIKDTIIPGTRVYTDEYVRREAQGKNVEMTLDVQASNEPLELVRREAYCRNVI
jgi:ISXO2-like transposase domain